jgi:hypothetical protein
MTGVITDEIESVAGELLPAITLTEALFVPNGLDKILAHIKAEVSRHRPDISTERGRKEIASLARKVASSKTRIDDFGKDHVAGIKVQAVAIDAERKRSRDYLDKLRDDTRQPLTDWENAEANRLQSHEDALAALSELGNVPFGASIEEISKRIDSTEQYVTLDWQEFAKRFSISYEITSMRLNKLHAETKQAEADKAALAVFQAAEAKRLQAEHEERIKVEAAAIAKLKAEAEAELQAKAVAMREAAEREAIEKAKKQAEQRAMEAEAAVLRAEAAVVSASIKAAEDAKKAIENERAKVAEKKRLEDAAIAKREANKKHVASIDGAIVTSLIHLGVSEAVAVKVVAAISKGEIQSVRISY